MENVARRTGTRRRQKPAEMIYLKKLLRDIVKLACFASRAIRWPDDFSCACERRRFFASRRCDLDNRGGRADIPARLV